MTREQAKQNLISIGITEPTDEQVTNYLNQVNGESKKERDKADKYKADAEKAADLQKQLDDINDQKLSEVEKLNKALDDANNKIAGLELQNRTADLKTRLVANKIPEEQADKLIESFNGGSLDVDVLAQIITDKETAAANAKEQEIAKNTTNPGDGSNGSGANNKDSKTESPAALAAKAYSAKMNPTQQAGNGNAPVNF